MNHILFYPLADINDVFIENCMPAVSHSASLIQCTARCDTALDPRTLMEYLFPDACHDEQTIEQMMVLRKAGFRMPQPQTVSGFP